MKILNLNNYVTTDKPEDATLKIVPHLTKDGIQLPPMYFISNRAKKFVVTVDNMKESVWHPAILIEHRGKPKDYIDLIEWWFNEAHENKDYRSVINDTFSNLDNLGDAIDKAKGWLKTESAYFQTAGGVYKKRKKEIGKFLQNWLNRQVNKATYGRP